MGFWKEVKKAGKKVEKVVRGARDVIANVDNATRHVAATAIVAQAVVSGCRSSVNKPK
jgi:hypothetical protein